MPASPAWSGRSSFARRCTTSRWSVRISWSRTIRSSRSIFPHASTRATRRTFADSWAMPPGAHSSQWAPGRRSRTRATTIAAANRPVVRPSAEGAPAATRRAIPDPPRTNDTEIRRIVRADGLVLVVHASPEPRTLAIHAFFRDRAARESESDVPEGTGDVLHRMMELGTASKSKDELRGTTLRDRRDAQGHRRGRDSLRRLLLLARVLVRASGDDRCIRSGSDDVVR